MVYILVTPTTLSIVNYIFSYLHNLSSLSSSLSPPPAFLASSSDEHFSFLLNTFLYIFTHFVCLVSKCFRKAWNQEPRTALGLRSASVSIMYYFGTRKVNRRNCAIEVRPHEALLRGHFSLSSFFLFHYFRSQVLRVSPSQQQPSECVAAAISQLSQNIEIN